MKINYLPLILGFTCSGLVAQVSDGSAANLTAELPTIVGPSPTVGALMRFEEVPVNTYTGIPQIDLPIFTGKTRSNNVSLNIGLSYHPLSVNASEVAPFTGLGWSLMAGGAISRTVRGLPDEYLELPGPNQKGKVGLYHTDIGLHSNNYYLAEAILNGGPDPGWQDEEFKWDAFERGKYDTQHDLYQFNFMGHSGRFIIKKDRWTNQLEVVPLDTNTEYRISLDYSNSNNQYTFHKFSILDASGTRYVFGVKEVSETSTLSTLEYFDGTTSSSASGLAQPVPTAFHLSQVYDPFGNLLISFSYQGNIEKTEESTVTRNTPVGFTLQDVQDKSGGPTSADYPANIRRMRPIKNSTTTTTTVSSQKVKKIFMDGVAQIEFSTDGQRTDTNLPGNSGARRLTGIKVKDWEGRLVKEFSFLYDYFDVPYPRLGHHKRLVLTEMRNHGNDIAHTGYQSHKFGYKDISSLGREVIKNPWDYFELAPNWIPDIAEKNYATVGVLERMELPTGGHVLFEFEPGTYSFVGNRPLTDFDKNPLNTEYLGTNGHSISTSRFETKCETFYPMGGGAVEIVLDIDKNGLGEGNWIHVEKVDASGAATSIVDCPQDNLFCTFSFPTSPDYSYRLCLQNNNMGITATVGYTVVLLKRADEILEYVHGGGIRIKSISTFENSVEDEPLTRKEYEYSLFSDPLKSSGSLSFAEPLFEHDIEQLTHFTEDSYDKEVPIQYHVKTDFNNLAYLKTQGAHVGYKNVIERADVNGAVKKGKTEFTYLSPIDYPEITDMNDPDSYDPYSIGYPFLPTKNYDYKRGLLKNKSVFDNSNKLKEVINDYAFSEEGLTMTGIMLSLDLNMNNQNPFAYLYDFGDYKYLWLAGNTIRVRPDHPASHIQMHPIREAKGWAKLISSTTKDYFYENPMGDISTVTQFAYNSSNKKIREKRVSTSQGLEVHKTEYLYAEDMLSAYPLTPYMSDLITANRIGEPIEQRESLKNVLQPLPNETLLNTVRAEYDSFSGRICPRSILQAKGGSVPLQRSEFESRVVFHGYDAYGRPTEVSRSGGEHISYIWGYRGQYPVAKMEGVTYAQAVSVPGLDLSVIEDPVDDNALSLEIQKIRDQFPDALISTYTYLPLVGLRTVTDPKGYRMTYEYDVFGRLRYVKDRDGNVLSENRYHYRDN